MCLKINDQRRQVEYDEDVDKLWNKMTNCTKEWLKMY